MRVDPKEIIFRLRANGDLVRKTARELGISPGTVINWRRKAATGQYKVANRYTTRGLKRHSTKPKTLRKTTVSAANQDRILALREMRGSGAIKITAALGLPHCYRTAHRYLKAKGLVLSGKSYRRPRYQKTTHMYTKNAIIPGILQMDVKYVTPELSGLLHTCYLYAVMGTSSQDTSKD
jgi:transposase